ncbi:hypothetical protein [Labedella populi]|nr:hypothetical protein [Labedella populi]
MGLVDLERGADRVLARRKTAAFDRFQELAKGTGTVRPVGASATGG